MRESGGRTRRGPGRTITTAYRVLSAVHTAVVQDASHLVLDTDVENDHFGHHLSLGEGQDADVGAPSGQQLSRIGTEVQNVDGERRVVAKVQNVGVE